MFALVVGVKAFCPSWPGNKVTFWLENCAVLTALRSDKTTNEVLAACVRDIQASEIQLEVELVPLFGGEQKQSFFQELPGDSAQQEVPVNLDWFKLANIP